MRWVSDPTSDELLADFVCGGTSDYERDVEALLDQLRELSPEEALAYEIRVAEARHADDLIGVSVFQKRSLGGSDEYADAVYLALSAINEPYRGWRMPDGTTRIGTFLLCDTLAQIDEKWGSPMPYVWGTVHEDNENCRSILRRHSFWRIKGSKKDPPSSYSVYIRQDGLDWTHRFSPQLLKAVEEAED